jgi:hypothetical protein
VDRVAPESPFQAGLHGISKKLGGDHLEVAMDSNNCQKGLETRDRDTEIKERTARVRAAVKELVDASCEWWTEVEVGLAQLAREERVAFVVEAGRACAAIGNYVAKATEAEGAAQ